MGVKRSRGREEIREPMDRMIGGPETSVRGERESCTAPRGDVPRKEGDQMREVIPPTGWIQLLERKVSLIGGLQRQ